jgi:hypothetical protein
VRGEAYRFVQAGQRRALCGRSHLAGGDVVAVHAVPDILQLLPQHHRVHRLRHGAPDGLAHSDVVGDVTRHVHPAPYRATREHIPPSTRPPHSPPSGGAVSQRRRRRTRELLHLRSEQRDWVCELGDVRALRSTRTGVCALPNARRRHQCAGLDRGAAGAGPFAATDCISANGHPEYGLPSPPTSAGTAGAMGLLGRRGENAPYASRGVSRASVLGPTHPSDVVRVLPQIHTAWSPSRDFLSRCAVGVQAP